MATSMVVLLFLTPLVCLVGAQTNESTCGILVDEIQVQADFDIDQYLGKWYEISWVQYYFEPPYANYVDFQERYDKINATLVESVNGGRVNPDDPDCIVKTGHYQITSNSAKWSTVRTRNYTDYDIDYWIITTDYQNYAFVYGCTRRNPNGTCQNAHAWKWSRTRTYSAEHQQLVEDAVQYVCMGQYDFIVSDQARECDLNEQTGGAPSERVSVALQLLYVLWKTCF